MRTKVEPEDLKVGETYRVEHSPCSANTIGQSCQVRFTGRDKYKSLRLVVTSGKLSFFGQTRRAGSQALLSPEKCTFYRVAPEPVTPYIELGFEFIQQGWKVGTPFAVPRRRKALQRLARHHGTGGRKMTERTEVRHEDLKVGAEYEMEHDAYGGARVMVERLLEHDDWVDVLLIKGDLWDLKNEGGSVSLTISRCTFYRVAEEPVTPHIRLGHDHIRGRKDVAFWITEQRGKWDDCFSYRGYTLNVPVNDPRWSSTEGILYPRGSNTDFDDYATTCTAAEWEGIKALVAAFNKHHADLAEKARAAPEAKPEAPRLVCLCCSCGNVMTAGPNWGDDAECSSCCHPRRGHNGEPGWLEGDCLDDIREYSGAKEPEPRKILDVRKLGSETTATECRDCGEHNNSVGLCFKYGKLSLRTGMDLRHADCLAAEKRYNDLLAITAPGEEK